MANPSDNAEKSSEYKPGFSTAASTGQNDIAIVNQKGTLKTFIERSPLGVQFALIVLFYLARLYSNNTGSHGRQDGILPFSFTSKEFFDAYSQLALEMGLARYLVRHMAFAEFMLTLEYLVIIREDELTSRYQFKISFEDLRWMALVAFRHIKGGQGLQSPEVFYPSPTRETMPPGMPQPDKTINPPTIANTDKTAALVKDLSQNIFSQKEIELNRGDGTSRSSDDLVQPRSTDYGLHRPYFQHRAPPTTYSFRKPDDKEWKRINREFFDGRTCVTCKEQMLPDYFDIWIGEPLDDSETPLSKRDQRMTEILAGIDDISAYQKVDSAVIQPERLIDPSQLATEREVLSYSYGIIPMDGRDAFIAFAKPNQLCPYCGTNPLTSVSLMPKY